MIPIHSYRRKGVGARLVNCYAEQTAIDAKGPVALVGAPGVEPIGTVGTGPITALHAFNGVLYAVSDGSLYEIQPTGSSRLIGEVSRGPVLVASNRTQMVIIGDQNWIYDGDSISEITDPDFIGADGIGFLDGYLLFIEPGSDRFYSSDLNNAESYDALNFATAEAAPDRLVGIIVDHQQIILAGETTTEVWWNAGNTGFPFERTPQGTIETGCSAGLSLAKADNTVFWLDDERIVRALRDLTPVRVSQHGVEEAFNSYDRVDDARAFTFTSEGHIFYVLTFPSEGRTWVYDVVSQEWHERESLGLSRWAVEHHAFVYGQNYVSKVGTNELGIIKPDAYTDFGEELKRQWTYQNQYRQGVNTRHVYMELVARRGVGPSQVTLEISNDGGRTFYTHALGDFGETGLYMNRCRFFNLGYSRDRVYRCTMSDPSALYLENTELYYA